jgi:hypothetical protein
MMANKKKTTKKTTRKTMRVELSARDFFAAFAMMGIISKTPVLIERPLSEHGRKFAAAASGAYWYADAMMNMLANEGAPNAKP